jgi:mono/diheme cytochrome c family protein
LATGALALAGCKSLPPPTPLAQLNAQQMHGHAVFQAQCSVCHYDRRNGPLHGPTLRGVFKMDYLQSGTPANDETVTATIMRGRGQMPPMGRSLEAGDLDDLLAYLHTL